MLKNTTLAGSVLAACMALSNVAMADDNDDYALPVQDNFVKTIVDKSVIAGEIQRDASGMITLDGAGKLMFDYTGDVYSMDIDDDTGVLEGMEEKIGTIQGQAAFPMEFAMLAIGMKAFLTGASPDMPAIPNKIDWTCNHCEMTIGKNTYVSVVDAAKAGAPFDETAVEDMRMQAKAYMGLGPVEIGQVAPILGNETPLSLTVRMAGCSAVVGASGPDAGKLGTICVNSTVSFDLSGIDLANPFASHITAEGTSNCITVLHKPMAM